MVGAVILSLTESRMYAFSWGVLGITSIINPETGAIATSICGAMNPNFSDEEISFLETVNDINFDDLTQVLCDIVE